MSIPFEHGPLLVTASGPDDGDPVILLHGWGSSAKLMEPVGLALQDRWRVYAVDLPGHGSCPPPLEPMDLPAHARAVASLIRSVAPLGAAIVGHSNGGRIALYMASDPELVPLALKLVLISPSGIRRRRSPGYYVRRTTAQVLKAPFRVLPAPMRDFGLDWLRNSLLWRALGSSDYRTLEGVMRQTFVLLVNHYVEDQLGAVAAPVLLFHGDRDDAVSRDQVDRLLAGVADGGLVTLPGAGHYGYLDAPVVFNAALRHFLGAA